MTIFQFVEQEWLRWFARLLHTVACIQVLPMLEKVSGSKKTQSSVILATNRLTGLTPKVNLRNPFGAGNKAHK